MAVKQLPEVISATRRMSLDELFETAKRFGEPEIGTWIGKQPYAEIKLHETGDHLLIVKCRRYGTHAENLAQCIDYASAITRIKDQLC